MTLHLSLFTHPRSFLQAFAQKLIHPEPTTDRQAQFNALLRSYSASIERICFGFASSRTDLDDLRQEALLNLWQSLPLFQGDCTLSTWVYRVTLNSCVTVLRKAYRTPSTVRLSDLYDVIDCADEQKEILADIHDAVAQLSPLDKAIVMLWLEGENYETIASITGVTKSNCAVRIHRAKSRLKQYFNE